MVDLSPSLNVFLHLRHILLLLNSKISEMKDDMTMVIDCVRCKSSMHLVVGVCY